MSLTEELLKTLEENAGLYRQLCEYSFEERKALEAGNLSGLEETTANKEKTVFLIRQADHKRMELTAKVADALGIPAGRFSLKDLSDDPRCFHHRTRILRIRQSLTELAQKAAELNGINRALIMNAMEVVRASVEIASARDGGATTYKPGKVVDGSNLTGGMVRRAL